MWPGGRSGSSSRNIHNNPSAGSEASVQMEGGNLRLSTRFLEYCPVTTPPNNQKKVTHSVAFPTNLPFKTLPQGQREFGLFEHVQFGSVQLLSHALLFAIP